MKNLRALWIAVVVGCGGAPNGAAPYATVPIPQSVATAPTTSTPIEAAPRPLVETTWSDADASVPVSSEDPSWGNRDALVTIVEFSDFQCPYCSKLEPTLDETKKQYGPEKVRFVWKNYPLNFHLNAKRAAEAAQGVFALAGNEAFWRMHDELFRAQSDLTRENFGRWAEDSGVRDLARFRDGLESHAFAEKVEKDMAVASKVGVRGTPSMYVNGVFVNGAVPFDKLKPILDQELAKAEAKIAAGTPRARVYVTMRIALAR